MSKRRQTVPAHVDVDIPAVPTTTAVPPNLLKTLIWVGGVVVLGLGGMGSWVLISNDYRAKAEAHDAQFVKREDMREHQREDIVAIKELAIGTNGAIMKLTEAINAQSATADMSRQWVKNSNMSVQASVTDLIARTCRKDNANSKDPLVCDKEIQAAKDAAKELKDQSAKANETTSTYQRIQIAPPTIAVPAPTTAATK